MQTEILTKKIYLRDFEGQYYSGSRLEYSFNRARHLEGTGQVDTTKILWICKLSKGKAINIQPFSMGETEALLNLKPQLY